MAVGFREFRWLSADGLELYSRVYDDAVRDGPTVMCLPGLTRNSRDFEDLGPHLARRHRVLAPDLRGRGCSARDPKWQNYHPGTYVQDVLQLLDLLGVERVALIGTSLGGLMSMIMCAVAPQRVAGVVLNDVGPEVDPAGLARIQKYAGKLPPVKSWQDAIAQTRQVYEFAWPGLPEERWPVLVRRAYRESQAGVPVPDVDPMVGEAIRSTEGAPKDLWPIFGALKSIPTLALRGETSDILSVATLERMQREKPDLEVLTVPNRGHVPLLDEPECLAAIDAFLARLRFQ